MYVVIFLNNDVLWKKINEDIWFQTRVFGQIFSGNTESKKLKVAWVEYKIVTLKNKQTNKVQKCAGQWIIVQMNMSKFERSKAIKTCYWLILRTYQKTAFLLGSPDQ